MPSEIFNDQRIALNLDLIKTVCDGVLSKEGITGKINVIFVGIDDMIGYNSYRGKDEPTDVLSFTYNFSDLLGEIYVCPMYVRENAKIFKVPFNEEIVRVCIHGVLHICGYDHEKDEMNAKKMFDKQDLYLSEFSESFDRIS